MFLSLIRNPEGAKPAQLCGFIYLWRLGAGEVARPAERLEDVLSLAFSFQLSAVSFINQNNGLYYPSKSIVTAPI
jgi:hypothetical protein